MQSKILKFLLIGLWIPSVTYSATESYSAMEEVSAPSRSVEALEQEEDPYVILMRARVGVQNWSKSDAFQSNSAFAYGTDIAFVWKNGFGISGHFMTGQSNSENSYGEAGKTRLSRLAIGPTYTLKKQKASLQAGLYVGQMIVNENYPDAYGQSARDQGYRIYGASLGVDVPIRQEWFGSLTGEYGYVRPVGRGSNFAVNSVSTGIGYRF